MTARDLIQLAVRNVARNRRRSLLAAATVTIGVAALLFSKASIDGLERLILEFVIEAREGAMQVQRRDDGHRRELGSLDLDVPERGAIADAIVATEGVTAVAPRLRIVGLLSNGEATVDVVAIGVDPEAERAVCPRGPGGQPADTLRGPGLGRRDGDEIVVGRGLARALDLDIGSQVSLLVQTGGGSLDTVDLVVAGTYPFPDPTEDKHVAYLPLETAQDLVHMPGRVTSFALATGTADRAAIDRVAARVDGALAGAKPALEVRAWHELSPYFRDVIEMEHQLMGVVIAVVFVLVVAGITNTMLLAVLERTREVGMLMSLGLRRRGILALFLIEAVLLAAVGSALGVAIGGGLLAAVSDGLSVELPLAGVVRIVPEFAARYLTWCFAAAVTGGLLGGLLPARRAARLRPIEALRR